MKKLITYLKTLWSSGGNSQSSDVGYDCRSTVVRPSFDRRSAMLKFVSVLVLILTIGVGQMWGGTATFTPTNAHTSEGDWTQTSDGVTISWHGTDDDYIKVYKGKTLTITSSNTITALNFTFANGSNNGGWNGSSASYSVTGLSTNSWSKTTTTGKSGKQARITELVVTFSGGVTYTVQYAAGTGGSGTNPGAHTGVSSGSSITLKANTFTAPTGKQFAGWNDGSNTYAAGASYTVTSDKTMTAQWECISPSISVHPASANYTVGDSPSGLSVTASLSSGTMTYLWKVSTNGGSTWSNASGTNNAATYAAANISTAAAGTTKYKCIVTNSTASCSTESNVATITVSAPATPATVTLENYSGSDPTGLHVGDSYTLPSSNSFSCGGKTFVGWSSVAINTPGSKPASNYWDKGASVTISSASMTFYAVFATGTPGSPVEHAGPSFSRSGTTNTITSGYTFTAAAEAKTGYYQDGSGTLRSLKLYHASTAIFSSTPSRVVLTAVIGGGTARDPLGNSVMAQLLDKDGNGIGNATTVTSKITTAGGDEYNIDLDLTDITSAYGVMIYHTKESSYNVRYYSFSLTYYTGGGTTYSNYTTACTEAPTATFSNGTYTIGGSALDLSSLWTSNSSGAVTYTITNAGGTGASISTASFTATTPGTCTVQASQAAYGSYTAITKTAEITVQNPTCATPTFDNGTNTYYNDVTVTISCATGSSTIHYTTGASPADPTCSSGSTGTSVTISSTGTTLKAVACKDGFNVSAVASATYTLKCATPTFSVAAGTYTSTQSVELSCTTTDAVIHYTVDGSTPTAGSPTYSSAITVDDDMTIKAIAIKTNYDASEVAVAEYRIKNCTWYESFDDCNGVQGPNPPSNTWYGISGSGNLNYDHTGWAVNAGGYGGTGAVKAGTTSTTGTITSPAITVDNGATGKVKFKMGSWNSSSTIAQVIFTGAEVSTGVSTWNAGSAMTDGEWNDYEVSFTTTSTSLTIQFTRSTGDNRFWLDEVCVKMDPVAYTVTFDANGHGSAPSAIEDVAKGSTINSSKPSDPTATGWSFGGWYKESTCDNAWDWANDVVNSNTTLWAKWTCSNPTSLSISSTGSKYDFCAGESMTLTVSGSNIGDGATYQWSLGGSPIDGATSASYTTTMAAAKAGEYTCTVSNGSCSQTTSGFWVRVWQLHIDNGAAGAWQDLDFSNTGTGTGNNTTVALSADGSYHFKLKDNNGGWFGLNDKTVTATESNITLNGSGANVNVNAGIGGNYTFAINYSDKNNPKISITYPTANQAAGKKIWFDKSIIDGWNTAGTSNIYYRIGHTTYSQSSNSWTLVPGTDRFYEYTTTAFDGFAAWQIANNYSQDNGSTSIYVVNGGHHITKSIVHQKYVVGNDGVTIVPGSSTGSSDGCTWYAVTKTDGMLTHTATITTPTNGTIHLAYTDVNSTAQDKTSTTAGLAHRTKITASADPDPGYQLSTFTVTPEGGVASNLTSGATDNHILATNATFAATFSAKTINITWNGNGGTPSKASDTWVYDAAALASLPTATNGSKIFVGWFTDPSAGSQIDNVGGSNKPTADITYYAHWSDGNIVQFHAGVGSVTPDKLTQTTIGGAVSAFPTPTIDCDGWSFAGWKEGSAQAETTTNPEASLYAAGTDDYVPASATVNMYAVWKKNFGGGTGTIDNTYDWEATNSSWSTNSISNVRTYTDYKHGGSYSGTTSADGAYVYFLTNMATPDSLVFYYTKASNNSSSSNLWKVQTSTNGSTWTDRASTLGTNSLTKGTYKHYCYDLTSLSNVYVRLFWVSSAPTAGNLDDVTIYYEGTRPDNWKWTSTAEDYGCVPANQVKTPVISPDTEAQTGDVSVTITCATDGATIRYTTDGTDPTSSIGTVYSGAFTVSCSATVKAIAYKADMDDSEIASQVYTITVPTPTFSLAEGTYYDANQSVTLSLPTAHTGTVIKYTTNGDDPTSSSATYSSAITVTEGTTTIKAIGYNSTCGTSSSVASATYIVRFGTDYTLVTDANDLMAGDQVVIISADAGTSSKYAISTTISSNKRTSTNDYNINAGLTTAKIYPALGAAATVQVFTLGGEPGAWTFHETTNNGYLNCPSAGKLTNTVSVSNSNKWTIAIASNIATIHNNDVDATIKSNTSSGHVFAAYGPATENVQLVKLYSIPNPDPVIKVEADLSAFSACRGIAGDYQSFIVSGKNLDGNIVISGPTGYEFCLTSGGSYTATLNITPVSKTVAQTTVYVRLAATATAGAHNGNLNAAVSVNSLSTDVAVTGSVSTADTYTDQVHNTVVVNQCGEYYAPSCPDASSPADESCVETHFKFMGWLTETDKNASGVKDDAWYIAHLITAGTAMTANGTNYYAVWAKEED